MLLKKHTDVEIDIVRSVVERTNLVPATHHGGLTTAVKFAEFWMVHAKLFNTFVGTDSMLAETLNSIICLKITCDCSLYSFREIQGCIANNF